MSLLNSDLFVIQRIDGTNGNVPGHYKLTGQNLKEYIAAGDTIVYKGSRDFANAAVDPVTDGTGVNTGDIYINSNPIPDVSGAWGQDILGATVGPGDRAIWNGTKWDLIHDLGDAGVTKIIPTEPITVDDSTPAEPVVGVNDALETSAALPQGRTSRKGVVSAIAIASDVAAADGVASPNPEAVVPADLLKATNDDVVILGDRVTVNEGDIVDIKGDIVDINGEITTLGDRVTVNEGDIVDIKGDIVDIKADVVNLGDRVTVNEGDIVDIKGDIVDINGEITNIKQDIVDINTEIGDINTEIGDITIGLETLTNGGGLSALKGTDPIVVTTVKVDPDAVEGDEDFGKTETTVSIKDGTTAQKGAVQLQETGTAVATSITVAATPGYVNAYYLVKDFDSFPDA